jgi:hypothetical protein
MILRIQISFQNSKTIAKWPIRITMELVIKLIFNSLDLKMIGKKRLASENEKTLNA